MESAIETLNQISILNKQLYIAFFLLFSCVSFAQESDDLYDHGLDQDKWQDIRDGIRYEGQKEGPGRQWTYENEEEYQRERQKYESGEGGSGSGDGSGTRNGSGGYGPGDGSSNRPRPKYNPPPKAPNSNFKMPRFGGFGIIGYILLGVFIVGIAFLIYYLFVNAEKKGAKIKAMPAELESLDPTEIPLTELERLLQEALGKGDYRGAIRIYFIFIIRGLAQRNWISWKKEKTNFHYLREMNGKAEFNEFNTSVSYFEFIWYGKREIDAEKFEQIKPKFTQLLDKLGIK